MKRKKISSTIVIILAMCLAITGCSGQQIKPTTTEEQKIAVQTQTQTEVEVTESETEPTVETEKPTENTESTTAPKKSAEVKRESEKPDKPEEIDTPNITVIKPNNTNSNTESKKPSSNNNTSNSNNENNNTSNKTESSDNKPSSKPVTVTDDTKLPHSQLSTAENMQRMVSHIISHNQSKGMIYDPSLNINNSGWLFGYQGCLNTTANRSYNEQLSRIVNGLDEDIDSILALDGFAISYNQMSFNCYAEQQSDGEYNIYFCYG